MIFVNSGTDFKSVPSVPEIIPESKMTINTQLLERRYRLLGAGAPLFYNEPVHIVKGRGRLAVRLRR